MQVFSGHKMTPKKDERKQEVCIREVKTAGYHNMSIRFVDAKDVAGGLDAIEIIDVSASVDVDAEGNVIGVHLLWEV